METSQKLTSLKQTGGIFAPGKKNRFWKDLWNQRYIQVFALAGIVYVFIFSIIPMVGLIISFKDYHLQDGFIGMFTSKWVGFKYFVEFFNEYNFKTLLKNTIVLSLLKMVFTFPIPIIFAIMLNEIKNKTVKKIVQTASYMPYFISWVIVAGFAVVFLNTQTGLINELIVKFGFSKQPVNFLTDPKSFYSIAVITAVWKEMGWWAIIFLASLTGIDPMLYEAAIIDGASRMARIKYITFPCIMPTITIVLILAMGNLFGGGLGGSNFDQSYLLGNPGNRDASDIIQTYVFRVGLSNGRYAYATAVGMIQSVISVILIFVSNKTAKKVTGTGLI